MPVHNWKPVDPNLFHHFHQRWAVAICDALNAGRLPSGMSALVEQQSAGLVPDVLTVQRRPRGAGSPQSRGGTLLTEQPKTRHFYETKVDSLSARGNRVVIRHRLGEVVCIIEIVSPSNKASKHAFRKFLEKTQEFLSAGVNLLVIDLLPPTLRDPQGIHKAIWEEMMEDPFEFSSEKPLTLAAYVAADIAVGTTTRAYVEPVAVGDVLPDMPAYLDDTSYVLVPLEATYQATWSHCPEDMRVLVETGRLPDEPEDA
jgi:hypothetical protein